MKPAEFYPAKLTPLFVRFIQSISYGGAFSLYHLNLKISNRDLEKLKALEDDRVVMLPNHPSFDDGIVLCLLSARLGQLFHYLIAYESFRGWRREFWQRMGCYSIKRGAGDRASIAYTLDLLHQPATKLVMFPEGDVTFQNDTVTLFRPGAIQLPLHVLQQLAKPATLKQSEAIAEIPNLFLVPISLKYYYPRSMVKAIANSLQHLESALGIIPKTEDFYGRLRAIGERVMADLEAEYAIAPPNSEELDLNQRIENAKAHILTDCEQKLKIASLSHLPPRARAYKIQLLLDSQNQTVPESERVYRETVRLLNCANGYNDGYATPTPEPFRESSPLSARIYKATVRLLNFAVIYDGYVAAAPTPERFLDTLTRLEREVFAIDRPKSKGHRHALLKIGDPVNLKDYLLAYQKNRTQTIEQLTRQIRQTVQENLNAIAQKSRSLKVS
ncbi:MAG: 1-acyl-sn-glycerol-3-phosphate acyltransferase [Spirulina sp.]